MLWEFFESIGIFFSVIILLFIILLFIIFVTDIAMACIARFLIGKDIPIIRGVWLGSISKAVMLSALVLLIVPLGFAVHFIDEGSYLEGSICVIVLGGLIYAGCIINELNEIISVGRHYRADKVRALRSGLVDGTVIYVFFLIVIILNFG